ncbi:MAG: universal stress protein [Pseudomonadota bacterium]
MTAKVLIPVDGARNSKTAEEYAVRLHQKMPMTVILLNVIDTKDLDGHGLDPGYKDSILATKRKWAEKALAESAAAFKAAGIKFEKIILQGRAAPLISYTAKTNEVDMIIISESGKSEFSDYFMGSVTNNVLYRSPVPVLLVKHPGREREE